MTRARGARRASAATRCGPAGAGRSAPARDRPSRPATTSSRPDRSPTNFELTQQAVSQHLIVLERAGLLDERRGHTPPRTSSARRSLEPVRDLLDGVLARRAGPPEAGRRRRRTREKRDDRLLTSTPSSPSVRIAAPPEVVFPYFTDPALAMTWIAEKADARSSAGRRLRPRRGRRTRPGAPTSRSIRRTGWCSPGACRVTTELPAGHQHGRGGPRRRERRHRGHAHAPRPARRHVARRTRRGGTELLGPPGAGEPVGLSRAAGRGRRRPGGRPAARPRPETRTCYSFAPARP